MSRTLRLLSSHVARRALISTYSVGYHPILYRSGVAVIERRLFATDMTDRIRKMTIKSTKPKTQNEEKKNTIQPVSLEAPTSELEAQTVVPDQLKVEASSLLQQDTLVVTRSIEFAQILVGFEQANKYEIKNAYTGELVGFIAEEESLGKGIMRNITTNHVLLLHF
jgi:hypothetical protein